MARKKKKKTPADKTRGARAQRAPAQARRASLQEKAATLRERIAAARKRTFLRSRSVFSTMKPSLVTGGLRQHRTAFGKGWMPLVSGMVPMVSRVGALVSAFPPMTIPRFLGMMPARRWGRTGLPATPGREPMRPKEIGLVNFLTQVLAAPVQPVVMVKNIAESVKGRVDVEQDPAAQLRDQLATLKMRRRPRSL